MQNLWLIFDIDGVLTDGRIWINEDGSVSKCMNMKDMDAVNELIRMGCRIAAITAEKNNFTAYVKNAFPWTCFEDGVSDKLRALGHIVCTNQLFDEQVVYIGDGKKDLPLFCGRWKTICPSDAIPPIRERADMVLTGVAGTGVLWEIVEWIKKRPPKKNQNKDSMISVKQLLRKELEASVAEHYALVQQISSDESLKEKIVLSGFMIVDALQHGKKVLIFGNGGSAADAQHIAAEFMGKFKAVREPLNVIALTANTSLITAIANDFDFSQIFVRQVEAMAGKEDVVIGISTSGKSENVLLALKKAHEMGAVTILLSSKEGSGDDIDIPVSIPSANTPRIQEMHILIGHYWAGMTETYLYGETE